MKIETITDKADLVIRRLILEPGEATPRHTDTCHRFTVVVRGSRLAIEFLDSGRVVEFDVNAGLAGWDLPEQQTHRAVNRSSDVYEEVVTFFREDASIDPQSVRN